MREVMDAIFDGAACSVGRGLRPQLRFSDYVSLLQVRWPHVDLCWLLHFFSFQFGLCDDLSLQYARIPS